MRRNPDDPLARGQQRLLKPAGDMPAVLDRPHAFVIQTACPPHRGQMPGIVGRDLPAAANLAGSLVHASERVLALVCVHPDHDHLHHPFVGAVVRRSGSPADTPESGRCHAPYL